MQKFQACIPGLWRRRRRRRSVELGGFDEGESLGKGLGGKEERRWSRFRLWTFNHFLKRRYSYHHGALLLLSITVFLFFLCLLLHLSTFSACAFNSREFPPTRFSRSSKQMRRASVNWAWACWSSGSFFFHQLNGRLYNLKYSRRNHGGIKRKSPDWAF